MTSSFSKTLEQISNDNPLKNSLLYQLSQMDEERQSYFKTSWPKIAPQRRREIMQALVEIGEHNFEVVFTPVFKLGLEDTEAEVRAAAIHGLWEEENPAFMRRFIQLLEQDSSPEVRPAAAIALGRFVYLGEVDQLDIAQADLAKNSLLAVIYRKDEPLEVRRRAVESVAYSSDEAINRIIEAAYYDEAELMQISAIFAMGRSADHRWLPRILTELDSSVAAMRFEAARACGELEASKAVTKLIQLINEDEDLEVQEMAIWALGHIGGNEARHALELCVNHEVPALALAAKESLDELNLFGDSLELLDFDDDLEDEDDLDNYDD